MTKMYTVTSVGRALQTAERGKLQFESRLGVHLAGRGRGAKITRVSVTATILMPHTLKTRKILNVLFSKRRTPTS